MENLNIDLKRKPFKSRKLEFFTLIFHFLNKPTTPSLSSTNLPPLPFPQPTNQPFRFLNQPTTPSLSSTMERKITNLFDLILTQGNNLCYDLLPVQYSSAILTPGCWYLGIARLCPSSRGPAWRLWRSPPPPGAASRSCRSWWWRRNFAGAGQSSTHRPGKDVHREMETQKC